MDKKNNMSKGIKIRNSLMYYWIGSNLVCPKQKVHRERMSWRVWQVPDLVERDLSSSLKRMKSYYRNLMKGSDIINFAF